MAFEAILDEVERLHSVSSRLERLAEEYPTVLDAILTVADSVRGAANYFGCPGGNEAAAP